MKQNLIVLVLLILLLAGYLYLKGKNTITTGMTTRQVEAIKKPARIIFKDGNENWVYPSKRIWSANGLKDSMVVTFKADTVISIVQ